MQTHAQIHFEINIVRIKWIEKERMYIIRTPKITQNLKYTYMPNPPKVTPYPTLSALLPLFKKCFGILENGTIFIQLIQKKLHLAKQFCDWGDWAASCQCEISGERDVHSKSDPRLSVHRFRINLTEVISVIFSVIWSAILFFENKLVFRKIDRIFNNLCDYWTSCKHSAES